MVCDDDEVASFAREQTAGVHWTPGLGLNAALSSALGAMTAAGVDRVVIAAGDLPFAHHLGHPEVLAGTELHRDAVVVIGDRHRKGTNVLSFTTSNPLEPRYGPGSLLAHLDQARRLGLVVHHVQDAALSWDIDTPEDLAFPAHRVPGPFDASALPGFDGPDDPGGILRRGTIDSSAPVESA